MATSRTFEIMREMKAAEEAKAVEKKSIVSNAHPDTVRRVFEMQQERVPCLFCGTITNTDVHVDNTGGISVYTLYRCPKCTHTFMEKDLYGQ